MEKPVVRKGRKPEAEAGTIQVNWAAVRDCSGKAKERVKPERSRKAQETAAQDP